MNLSDGYSQIPIPDDLPDVYQRAERRWQKRRQRRLTQLAACIACAASLAGFSIPVLSHMRSSSSAPAASSASSGASSSAGSASSGAASSQTPLPTDPAAGHEVTYSFLPTYKGDIKTLPSETTADTELAAIIRDYYDIPAETGDGSVPTRYYYNSIDLNGDGTDEVFADVMGTYTSGTGGDSALLLQRDSGGKLTVLQSFTLVNIPVIVSDHATNGWKDLIVPYTGGGAESTYTRLTFSGGKYANVPDGTPIPSLDGVTGTSILYTDVTDPGSPVLTLDP